MWINLSCFREAICAEIPRQLCPFSPHCSGAARIPRGILDMMSTQWGLHALKLESIYSYTNKILCAAFLSTPKTTPSHLFTMSAEGASASVRWSQVTPRLRYTNAQLCHRNTCTTITFVINGPNNPPAHPHWRSHQDHQRGIPSPKWPVKLIPR